MWALLKPQKTHVKCYDPVGRNSMKSLLAAAAIGLAAWAGAADATVITITETGTIVGDDNTYGTGTEFGAVAADLIGLQFSVTYQFDTDLGDVMSDAYGSYFYGPGTASITINGITQTVSGDPDYSTTQRSNLDPSWGAPYPAQYFSVVQTQQIGGDFVEDYLTPSTPFASTDLTAPYYHQVGGADLYQYVFGQIGDTHFHGSIETLSANGGVAPVPEPASWALMLAGFGAIGAAMRSRRRVAVRFA